VDGVNEKGLAGLWLQYALDNAASVSEALALLEPVQVVMVEAHGHKASVHLALEDASGDSAIIEYIEGRAVIHHGRQYTVMTNDPPYDQQLALLKKMDAEHAFTPVSRETPLPGNVNPVDRFQRIHPV
jgi:penicillin V acylase-like amidase (Ntn superfamily)